MGRPIRNLAELRNGSGSLPPIPPNSETDAIVALLEIGLRAKYDATKEERTTAHVSDAGKCPRALYYRMTGKGETNPMDTSSLINFMVGRAVESAIAEMLRWAGAKVIRETAVDLKYKGNVIPGHIDHLIHYDNYAREVLFATVPNLGAALPQGRATIETKSISSRNAWWMLKEGRQGQDDHRKQLRLYRHAAEQGAIGFDEEGDMVELAPFAECPWYLVYVVKDSVKDEPNIYAYEVPYDAREAEKDLAFLASANGCAEAEVDPGRPPGYVPTRYPCKGYCNYRTLCWGDEAR